MTAIDVLEPGQIVPALTTVENEGQRDRLLLTHARWEPLPLGAAWLIVAAGRPGAAEVLQERLAESPDEPSLGRLEQDLAEGDAKAAVCERHRARAEETSAGGARYLAIRCLPDGDQRDDAFLAAHDAHPDDPWLSLAVAHVHFTRERIDDAIAEIAHARTSLQGTAGDLALVEARMRRYKEADADLGDLVQASPELQLLVGYEEGSAELPGAEAYAALGRGDLETAIAAARDDERSARIVRLAGASIGAPESLVMRARGLPPEAGVDIDTVCAALALARRFGDDDAPYLSFVREHFGETAERVLTFADRDALLADVEGARGRLAALAPEVRGHASVLGVLTLGADAPAAWREDARRLLFAHERPWLGRAAPLE